MKRPYKVLYPIGFAGRRERGEVIMLTESEAAHLGDAVAPFTEEVPPVVQEIPVEKMTLPALIEKARALKLNTSGSKADLLERISLALKLPV